MKKHFSKDGKTVHPYRPYKRKRHHEPGLATNAGIRVRSEPEKLTAEFLDKQHIRFLYEPLMLLNGRQYRPDFFLPDYNLFIEICGYTHMPFYRDRVAYKRKLYAQRDLHVLFIECAKRSELIPTLRQELGNKGVKLGA